MPGTGLVGDLCPLGTPQGISHGSRSMKLSGVHLGAETRVSWLFITGWKWEMGLIQVWKQASSGQEASNIALDAVWDLT